MSKVSIIVPVYNAEKMIGRCLDSILAQDYKDIEAIVVDDGSKDSSFEIISEYAKKDERVIAIHKDNSGVSSTRNLAISKATGDYIQFIDADDWLPFDSTKLLVRTIEEDKTDMVIADFYRVIDDKYSRKGSIRKPGVYSIDEFADKMLLSPADFYYGVLWNKLYKKEIIDKYDIRMDESISMSEDLIYNLQYFEHIEKLSVLKSPVYYYVKTEGSLVTQNVSVEKIVKQKTNVIPYYEHFYQTIFSEEEYESRKIIIKTFMVAVASDYLAIPIIEDTRSLKEDSLNYLNDEKIADELKFESLSVEVFDRLLDSLAKNNKLDLNDAKVLYYMYKKQGECSTDELSDFCRLNKSVITLTMAKLLTASYVKTTFSPLDETKVRYEYVSNELDQQFDKVEEDYRSLIYNDLSIEDVAKYAEIKRKIFANMKKTVVNE